MLKDALSADGVLDIGKLWVPTAKNTIIRMSDARNRLRVGGTGSSKSSDAMMEMVQDYLLPFPGCFGLVLRRTMDDLRKSNIPNFQQYVPAALYKWDATNSIAKFYNGSRLYFSHMTNFSWKDMESYQSSAFPIIFIDECGGFPIEIWRFLQSRNRVNPECKEGVNGGWPRPAILGATNPIGAHWGEYKASFVDKKPHDLPKGSKKDKYGRWWSPARLNPSLKKPEDWRLEYDPQQWEFVHSTVLDNPYILERDPDIVARLNAIQPESLRKKLLDGYLDTTVGQYYDCFDPDWDVINLRSDPDAIVWQYWQPRWLGWDWGRAHWNTVFWFTKALVRRAGCEYKLKTVCYREFVDKGLDYVEMVDIVEKMTRMGLPGEHLKALPDRKGADYRAAYFSHEKFAKQMEAESPASKLSKMLMDRGLPGITRGTTDRIGRATLLYHLLTQRDFVILDSCPELINAIPNLTRDEDQLEDVLKVDGKSDDCYDGATLGLFGELGIGRKPKEEIDRERLAAVDEPMNKALLQIRLTMEREKDLRRQEERRPSHWE